MAGRIDTVVKALTDANLDASVAFSTSFHSFLGTDGVRPLTGFKPLGESAALVVPDGAESLSPEMATLGTVAA